MHQHPDSHLDHGLTEAQISYILLLDVADGGVTVKTIELPKELGTVPCALHGPAMGDAPVPDDVVCYAVRGDRAGESRLVDRPVRQTRFVTIVAGPHDGHDDVLYTAYGGPAAPREPFELPTRDGFTSFEAIQSREFWAQHALSKAVAS